MWIIPQKVKEWDTPVLIKIRELTEKAEYSSVIIYTNYLSSDTVNHIFETGYVASLYGIKTKDESLDSLIYSFLILGEQNQIYYDYYIDIQACNDACTYRSFNVIQKTLQNKEQYLSTSQPFIYIYKRDDPELLYKCLTEIAGFYGMSHEDGKRLMTNCLEDNCIKILETFDVFIDLFHLTDNDIECAVDFYEKKSIKPPYFVDLYKKTIILEESVPFEAMPKNMENDYWPIGDSDVDGAALNKALQVLLSEDIIERNEDPIFCDDIFTTDEEILFTLPRALLENPNLMIRHKINLSKSPVGRYYNATGTGPWNDILKYAMHWANNHQDAFQIERYALPTNKDIISIPKRQFKKMKQVMYALGVLYSKNLYSRNKNKIEFSQLHIWFFRWLIESDIKVSDELLIREAKLVNEKATEEILKIHMAHSSVSSLSGAAKQIKETILGGVCKELLECFRKGFLFIFDPSILPSELSKPMKVTRHHLKKYFDEINKKKTKAEALFIAINGPRRILMTNFLKNIKYRFMERYAYNTDMDPDDEKKLSLEECPKERRENIKTWFKTVISDWEEEPHQINLKKFLKSTIGRPYIGAGYRERWTVCFIAKRFTEFSMNVYTWGCDFNIAIKLPDSEEELRSYMDMFTQTSIDEETFDTEDL